MPLSARRPRLGDPRRARRIHAELRRRRCPPIPRGCCAASAKNISRRLTISRKRARSGGRASCASPAGSRIGRSSGAATSPASTPRSGGEICRFRSAAARTFMLSARADRIERRRDGSFAILDYKTGQPPTGKQVRMGLSPQLTLEAAILREGGFESIAAGALGQRTRSMSGSAATIRRASKAAGIEDRDRMNAAAARRRRRSRRATSSKR